ncbi:MAG: cupredoxin domain-containing protein [Candidatus Nitrosocosmicus sp.]
MNRLTNAVNLTVLMTVLFSSSVFAFCIISTNNFQKALAVDNTATAVSQGSNGTTSSLIASTADTTTNATTSHTSNSATTINFTVKEVTDGVYKWINSSNSAQNPTIKVMANTNNIINIQNPTDTKHQLIVDTGADNLPSSGDILQDGSGHLTFNPTNMTGTITYHCAYHPYTMKGTIEIIKK